MMKKLLGLLVVALFCLATANASTMGSVVCGSDSGPGPGDPLFSGSYTCTVPAIPLGDTLNSIDLVIENSFDQGEAGTNAVVFTYTISGFNSVTALTTTVSGSVGPSSESVSTTGMPSCLVTTVGSLDCPEMSGDLTTSFTVTGGASSWLSGGVNGTGNDSTIVSVDYSYSGPTAQTPEPATLLLIGGGLVGLALAVRRRQKV
jgi:hypothetical protein